MTQSRQLAAIMFTDMVGYSALMGVDQHKAFTLLRKNRQIQKPLIEKYNGKWLKEMGDGILASFSTISDAVFCAIAIQNACVNDPDLKLRIGIHQGEVVFENNDVFGDGVNIASRIEPLAPPGGIYISSTVYHNISNRKEFQTTYISELKLKNIDYPIKVYQVSIRDTRYLSDQTRHRSTGSKNWRKFMAFGFALVLLLAAIIWWMKNIDEDSLNNIEVMNSQTEDISNREILALPSGPRIAVLQFSNLSNDSVQDYFVSGLTEDIITGLSQTNLFVLASATSFRFSTDSMNASEIANKLNVRYLLKGSVRKQRNTIRVTAQLIDGASEEQLWGSSYDRDLTASDIFSLQDDITKRVVSTISDTDGIIVRANLEKLGRKLPEELDAYECVLRSYKYAQTHTPEDHLIARSCLEKAIKNDSNYVDGMAQLAYLYREEYQHNFNQRPKALERAEKLSRKAIELDPLNQDAYYALALAYFGQREIDNFFIAAENCMAQNPNNSNVIGGLGIHIALAGDWDRGIDLLEKTMMLNPYSSLKNWLHFAKASDYCLKERYSKALAEINQAQYSDVPLLDITTIAILVEVGQKDKAKEKFIQMIRANPQFFENARNELERFYLVNHNLVDLFMKNLGSTIQDI